MDLIIELVPPCELYSQNNLLIAYHLLSGEVGFQKVKALDFNHRLQATLNPGELFKDRMLKYFCSV